MVRLQEELRSELRSTIPDRSTRERVLREVLNDREIWSLLLEDRERAMARAREIAGRISE
jgi:siroheme synthase (precorrin-2 oxidase/ferrochelatase)